MKVDGVEMKKRRGHAEAMGSKALDISGNIKAIMAVVLKLLISELLLLLLYLLCMCMNYAYAHSAQYTSQYTNWQYTSLTPTASSWYL